MLVSCTIDVPEIVKKQIEAETAGLFALHPEYLWYDIADFYIPLFQWNDVEPDLVEKLSSKIAELMFEQKKFILYSEKYVVKISNHIDVVLHFQEDRRYRELVKTVSQFFAPELKPSFVPSVPVARYKIPSKQQYSHLKNQLSKIKTEVEVGVDGIGICKVTDFGNGIRKYDRLTNIKFEM